MFPRFLLCLAFVPVVVNAAEPAESAAPRCHYVQVAKLPLRYAGTGLVPAIDGSIDGAPATMLVDTGSSISTLTLNAATRRGMPLSMTGRRVNGVGGLARLYTTRVHDLAIGPIRRERGMDMMVTGDLGFTPAFDAILGAPFLLQMDMMLDLRAKELRLYRPQACDRTPLMLWQEPTIVVPFTVTVRDDENPHFTVLVNGKKMDAAIDSGAHHSVMLRAAAERAGIDLKGPGVTRLRDVSGIGTDRAPHWTAPTATIQIGDEIVRDAEIGIIDAQGMQSFDMLLGQDFLRAHRVLFAMSQRKLYIAYLGGNAFMRGTGLEPWMLEEAEAGNADAQYVAATQYRKAEGASIDAAQAEAWLQKAAAQGEPHARLALGRRALLAGDAGAAVTQLRAALDQLPADRHAPLWLYLARVRSGDAERARGELAANLKAQSDEDEWPLPVARFYLAKWDAARLLEEAGKDKASARGRTCEAEKYIAEWHAAQGDEARAKALEEARRAHCAG